MANKVEQQLTPELHAQFEREHFVLLSSVDFETNAPNTNAISWIYAPTEGTFRFALDQRSRIVENVRHHSGVTVTFFADETVYAATGKARVLVERLEGVPLKLAVIEIDILSVRDVMFYGSKIAIEPTYEKTYDAKAAAKLDKQVMDAMKLL